MSNHSSNLSNKMYAFKRNMRKSEIQKKCQQIRAQLVSKNKQKVHQINNQQTTANGSQTQQIENQLIDQFDKPSIITQFQAQNINNIDFAQALTLATNFQIDNTNQKEVRLKINFISLICKFWEQEIAHPSLLKQRLTKNQLKAIKILEKLNYALNDEEIYYVLQIYTFICKKSKFHNFAYIGYPIAIFLKRGIISNRIDQIISLMLNYIEDHHFKNPEHLGQLINYTAMILSYFLKNIFQQKHLITLKVQNKLVSQKFYLSFEQVVRFYNHVSSLAETFLFLGNNEDLQNIISHLLYSLNILKKMNNYEKSYFHIDNLKSMINILYVACQISSNRFQKNHKYLLNLIYEVIKDEPTKIIQLKENTLLDAYLIKIISSGNYGKEKIKQIFEICQSQKVLLQAMPFKTQKQRISQIQKPLQ